MSENSWNRFCKFYKNYPATGIAVDISQMPFPDSFLQEMKSRSENALSDMAELEGGAIANPDEQRMVGHYWLRNSKLAPSGELQTQISTSIERINDFAKATHNGAITTGRGEKFTDVLLIGIGGSALGPQLLNDIFAKQPPLLRLHFFDNTDPDGMERTLLKLGDSISTTLVLVVSKSGGTVETKNGLLVASAIYKKHGLEFNKHAIAITVNGSALDKKADQEQWLNRFHLWDWVGGRTSIFSAVGLLPAALIGLDTSEFLLGASQMDEATRNKDYLENPAMLLALMWYWAGDGKGEKSMVILPYKDSLVLFSKYLQQLVMESIGKEKNLDGKVVNQGLSVFGNKGSTDQHAYVQQLRDGRTDFFVTFIEVLQRCTSDTLDIESIKVAEGQSTGDFLQGFYLGTRAALKEGGRHSISITLDSLSASRVGALIALYERAVGLYASLVSINAYHQPGVESGKKAAAKIIELQKKIELALPDLTSPFSAPELADQIGEADQTELVFKLLVSLCSKQGTSLKCTNELHPLKANFSNT